MAVKGEECASLSPRCLVALWLIEFRHSYMVKLNLTSALIADRAGITCTLVHGVFDRYGLSPEFIIDIAASLQRDPEKLAELLTEFSFKHKKPESARPAYSALTIGGSYMLGGLVPLIPYFCIKRTKVLLALYWSICTMVGALFAFGWTKTAITDGWKGKSKSWNNAKAAIQMVLIGAVAAGVAVGLTRAVNRGAAM